MKNSKSNENDNKSNIKTGKTISVLSNVIGAILFITGIVIDYISKANEINNLKKTGNIAYEMGVYEFHTNNIGVIFMIVAVFIYIIGGIISFFLCKCSNCGHSVMTQYGSLYDYCPKCGKKVNIEDK